MYGAISGDVKEEGHRRTPLASLTPINDNDGMAILVTGGAGYIGSHVVWALRSAGRRSVVLDDLSTGVRENLPTDTELLVGDVTDPQALDAVFARGVRAVLHFAARASVPESLSRPLPYYRTNTAGTLALLEACIRHEVSTLVFSSSCAVYGSPGVHVIDEDTPLEPVNPYGASKAMAERMILDTCATGSMRALCLRYFNVAGADPGGRTGESTPGSHRLVKVCCEAALGRRARVGILGTDYDTPDGTCVRDYIHVSDLADLHLLAIDDLEAGGESGVLNCGYGRGFSVREVVDAAIRISGVSFDVRDGPRRPGDPPHLVADTRRLRSRWAWQPRMDDLDTIVSSALAWEGRTT